MKEQYMDILRDVLAESNWEWGDIYPDGDGNNEEVFIYEPYKHDISELNAILKNRLKAKGIDTYPDYDRDDYYVDFVTGDNWGFNDSYFICEDCGKAYRINEYGSTNYWHGDGFILCENCVKEGYAEEYIEDLVNDPQHANVIFNPYELIKLGFEKVGGQYENGLYGINHRPKEIFDKLKDSYKEIIFHIDESNPFAIYFSAWARKEVGA